MKELFDQIMALAADFSANAKKAADGNKAAGARARKASLALEKALKAFRAASIAATK